MLDVTDARAAHMIGAVMFNGASYAHSGRWRARNYLSSVRGNISTYDAIYLVDGRTGAAGVGDQNMPRHIGRGGRPVQILHDDFGAGGIAVTLPI